MIYETIAAVTGLAVGSIASAVYYQAKSSALVKAYIRRGEALSHANEDYVDQLFRANDLKIKLDALAAKQPTHGSDGRFISKATHNAERAKIRAVAKDMAASQGNDKAAGVLS
jgi:hypothetical protein